MILNLESDRRDVFDIPNAFVLDNTVFVYFLGSLLFSGRVCKDCGSAGKSRIHKQSMIRSNSIYNI